MAHQLNGRVVRADGSPAPGAIIIASDPSQGKEWLVAHTAEDGRFVTNLNQPTVALTITSVDQSIYLANIAGDHGPVEIRLDASCSGFNGRIESQAPIPKDALVRLSRVSTSKGDVFGAAVATNGSFRACVPEGRYVVHAPDGFVQRRAVAVIPSVEPYLFRTESRAVAEKPPDDLNGLAPEPIDGFIAGVLASTRVLGLGESNHGTREFYDARAMLALALASKGFRLLMLETGYGETLALDDYINGEALDVAAAVQRLGYWTWDTKTFLAVLAQLRAYNATQLREHHIHLIGFDVQDTTGAIDYLRHNAESSIPPDVAHDLQQLTEHSGSAWSGFTAVERKSVREALGRIGGAHQSGDSNSRLNRLALAARSLLLRFDTLEATDDWQFETIRDAGMAQMILDALALEPGSHAMLWAHLGHLAREVYVGRRTLGASLASQLGETYRVYGLFAVSGSARAWDPDTAIGVIVHSLRSAPSYSLEAVLAAQSGGGHMTYWTFARATAKAASWLGGVHAMREFGATFPREGDEFSFWDLRGFDGAILFDTVTPTDPTPTGERWAKPRAH